MSIASQRGVWSHYHQELPLHIVYRSRDARRSVFLRGGPSNCLIDSHFVQDGTRMLGITYWNPLDWQALKLWWPDGPPFRAEHHLYLGRAEDFHSVKLDGERFEGEMEVGPDSTIEIVKPDLWLRLRSVAPPAPVSCFSRNWRIGPFELHL